MRIFFQVLMASTILLVSAGVSFADCSSVGCTGKIERLYIDGTTLYIASDGDESLLNCTSPANVYVTLPTSDPDFDRKYAMLLTAFSLKATVGLRINDGSAACSLNYVYVDG